MSGLKEFTQEQLAQFVDYLVFEQQKRRETKTEISGELSDLLDSSIESETIYSGKDILETLSNLPELLNKTVDSELERHRDITAVLLKNILVQAQQSGLLIQMNVPEIDSEEVTDDANAFCGTVLSNRETIESKAIKKNTANKEEASPGIPEPKSSKDVEYIRAENERLKQQLTLPIREYPEMKAAMEKLKELNKEVHELRSKLNE
ncbi:hypothetical protein GPJ56_008866 [Histomonas meleagridis]|uniref:uncharacterized protein n=1 Tax=Histomonas meleagridis TaxID=135588 RepID=UPI00355A4776|nr:hypothetical protein GPJ56_008866 [Histomonas meleagridis]KAH0797792.1 hypothetical protein GO595_009421 [Histomonas meleagridis]